MKKILFVGYAGVNIVNQTIWYGFAVLMVMWFFNSGTDVSGAQHRENESLQECDQQFQGHHEQGKRNGSTDTRDGSAHAVARLAQDENQAHERKNYNVAGRDVRKKTKHEGKWLQEKPQNFYRSKNQYFKQCRHAWHPQRVFPEMLFSTEHRDQECQNRHYNRNGNITSYVGTSREKWNLTDQIKTQNKEKCR